MSDGLPLGSGQGEPGAAAVRIRLLPAGWVRSWVRNARKFGVSWLEMALHPIPWRLGNSQLTREVSVSTDGKR